jgi:large subunit ribosomal protein L21
LFEETLSSLLFPGKGEATLFRLQLRQRPGGCYGALSSARFLFANSACLWNFGRLFLPPEALVMAYAIIRTGGRQFRVAEGDTIDVDLLNVDAGKTATFGEVLMFADGKDVTHGDPLVTGAKVTAEVVEQRKDKKVVAFKYKRRKGYHRTVGHRRKLTRVKIKSINLGAKKPAAKKTDE